MSFKDAAVKVAIIAIAITLGNILSAKVDEMLA